MKNRALLALAPLAFPTLAHAQSVSFSKEIAPIIQRRCAGCHGERTNLGDWRAHTFMALMKPGASGAAMVVPGKPEASELYKRVAHKDPDLRMPKSDDALSAQQLARVKRWIVEGAKFDGSSKTVLLKTLLGPRVHPAAPASYRTPVPVLALAFVPGGKQIAVGGYNEVTLWDAETGKLVRRIGGLPQRIQSLQVSKDGKSLLVGGGIPGEYGEVALVELATGKRRVLDTFGDLVLTARFNTDETKVAAGGAEASVRCYDIKNGERLWSMSVHADWVTSVAFSADGKYVASASRDHTVKVYEANGTLYTTYGGHNRQIGQYRGQDPVYGVCFTGNTALSVGGGKWVQQWEPEKAKAESGDAGDMEERFFKQGHAKFLAHGCDKDIYQLCLKDGQVFTLASDGIVKQLDLISQKEIRSFGQSGDFAFSLDADTASKRIVTGSFDGTVRVFDVGNGQQKRAFAARPN
ncbi:MAG: hypothetical protein NTX57_15580 [Armatimonadetes bacterium]|nr:hypothetical protein [Armatimonadota bacterium]